MYESIKNSLFTSDYDFLWNNPHLGGNIILLGLGGSYAYGTNIETSDVDIRGVALNSADEILLSRDFESVVNTKTDTTIYSFVKMIQLLIGANPNVIELLGLRQDQYFAVTEVGQQLLDHKDLFLSKKVVHSFGGYAHAQLRRLDNKSARHLNQTEHEHHVLNSVNNAIYSFSDRYALRPEDSITLYIDKSDSEEFDSEIFMDVNLKHYPLRDYCGMWNEMKTVVKDYDKVSKRNKNALEHNKISKHMLHLLRLYMMCIDILEKHEINTYREDEHDLLMSIRNNDFIDSDKQPTEEFNKLVDYYQKRMEQAAEKSTLPDAPDYDGIQKFVTQVHRELILNS
jgi:predicted nucleotidyltransferase